MRIFRYLGGFWPRHHRQKALGAHLRVAVGGRKMVLTVQREKRMSWSEIAEVFENEAVWAKKQARKETYVPGV